MNQKKLPFPSNLIFNFISQFIQITTAKYTQLVRQQNNKIQSGRTCAKPRTQRYMQACFWQGTNNATGFKLKTITKSKTKTKQNKTKQNKKKKQQQQQQQQQPTI